MVKALPPSALKKIRGGIVDIFFTRTKRAIISRAPHRIVFPGLLVIVVRIIIEHNRKCDHLYVSTPLTLWH